MPAAWLFPGQGSQSVGMAAAWARASTCAADALAEAAEVLGFDLPRLIFEGPAADLDDTYNQQPALLAASVAILRAAFDRLPEPVFVAGHSLGEYAALVAAGSLAYPDALRLVRERGRLMRQAGRERPGGMAAILGLDDATVERVCRALPEVQVANYNAPGQVVISGSNEGVGAAVEALRAAGARRVMPLPITIAAHSALMAPAAGRFAAALRAAPIGPATVPVLANLSAQPIQSVEAIRAELEGQLTGSVRWTASIQAMRAAGVDQFFEIGPGRVLSGLVKRIGQADGGPPPALHTLETPDGVPVPD